MKYFPHLYSCHLQHCAETGRVFKTLDITSNLHQLIVDILTSVIYALEPPTDEQILA